MTRCSMLASMHGSKAIEDMRSMMTDTQLVNDARQHTYMTFNDYSIRMDMTPRISCANHRHGD